MFHKVRFVFLVFATFLCTTPAAFGQTAPLNQQFTAVTPCPAVLHPDPLGQRLTPPAAQAQLASAQTALRALPGSATEARRNEVLDLFYILYARTAGGALQLYSFAAALQQTGELRRARHALQCLQESEDFGRLYAAVRATVPTMIATLSADIASQESHVVEPPHPDPLVATPVLPVGPIVVRQNPVVTPPVVSTPHPRSATRRFVGQVGTVTGVVALVGGAVVEGLCFDRSATIDAANVAYIPRGSQAEVDYHATYAEGQTLCTLGPVLLGTGATLTAGGLALWLTGARSVTDTPPPPRAPVAFGFHAGPGGGGAHLTLSL